MIEERGRSAGQGTLQVAIAVAVVVAVLGVFAVQVALSANSRPEPMKPVPGLEVGDVPVWYDDAGLHRGDVVEQTPVELREMDGDAIRDGALALVRTGALYLDPASGDVWFHPWGGQPRIVGHDSSTGPSANPGGDIAAWFDGVDLVLYDTAEGVELVRDSQVGAALKYHWSRLPDDSDTCYTGCYEHAQPGNGFLDVSADRVVWTAFRGVGPTFAYDVSSGEVSRLGPIKRSYMGDVVLADVRGDLGAYAVEYGLPGGRDVLVLTGTGWTGEGGRQWLPAEPGGFNADGRYLLVDDVKVPGEGVGQGLLDTSSGRRWLLPSSGWLAWSYGDIALAHSDGRLTACHAADNSCDKFSSQGAVLMPTN